MLLLFVAFCSWLFWLVRDISFSDIGLQTSHPIITIAAADSSPLSWDGNVRGSPISRENLPQNRLAIIPNRTHYDIFFAPELVRTVLPFLNGETEVESWEEQLTKAQ